MFRKLGFGSGSKSKKRPQKKRLSPSVRGIAGDETGIDPPPSYQYAMNEYALTGASKATGTRRPNNVDDEGRIRPSFSMMDEEDDPYDANQHEVSPPQKQVQDEPITTQNIKLHEQQQKEMQSTRDGILRSSDNQNSTNLPMYSPYARRRYLSPQADYFSYDEEDTAATFGKSDDDDADDASTTYAAASSRRSPTNSPSLFARVEPMMPDATYEEWYGDAYVSGPIRYIYPSGYQSMRPNGGPWKLSMVVCISFTWLSVFVIGYCSDMYSENQKDGDGGNYYYNNDDGNNMNDIVIEEKWCGSVMLYWLWYFSMLITALSSAYCSVIGYIKVRDFAVANTRSQPPGIMMVGDYSMSGSGSNNKSNSDYYVPIGNTGAGKQAPSNTSTKNYRLQQTHPSHYTKTIYQADGTPQFWGNQIYRPTQAAVHTVSR